MPDGSENMKISVEDFARRVRDRYPGAYDDMPDRELAERVIRKYPVYADSVDISTPAAQTQPATQMTAPAPSSPFPAPIARMPINALVSTRPNSTFIGQPRTSQQAELQYTLLADREQQPLAQQSAGQTQPIIPLQQNTSLQQRALRSTSSQQLPQQSPGPSSAQDISRQIAELTAISEAARRGERYQPRSTNETLRQQPSTPTYTEADFTAWVRAGHLPKTAASRARFEAELRKNAALKQASDIISPAQGKPSPTFAAPTLPTPTAQPGPASAKPPSTVATAWSAETLSPTTSQPNPQPPTQQQPAPGLPTAAVSRQTPVPKYTDADFTKWASEKGVPKTAISQKMYEAELKAAQAQKSRGISIIQKAPGGNQYSVSADNPYSTEPQMTEEREPTPGEKARANADTKRIDAAKKQAEANFEKNITSSHIVGDHGGIYDFENVLGTVKNDPKLSDEEMLRKAANEILPKYDPQITPREIDEWIDENRVGGTLISGPRTPRSKTFAIRGNMLGQIQDARNYRTAEQLYEEQRQRVIGQQPTEEEYRQRAIAELKNEKFLSGINKKDMYPTEPVSADPTESEIQQRTADLKAAEPTQENKAEEYDRAQRTGAGEAGLYGGLGDLAYQVGGVLRPFGLGRPLQRLGNEMQLVTPYRHGGQGNQGIAENVVGFLGESVPQVAEMVFLPGGPVAKFGFIAAARAAGQGKSPFEVGVETLKGMGTGGVFKWAEELENPIAKLGTVFGGSAVINAASGMPIDENLKNSIVNTLFVAQGIYGKKIAGQFFTFWKGGEPLTVGVTPKGEIVVPRKQAKAPNSIVLDPENEIYRKISPNQFANAPRTQETLKPITKTPPNEIQQDYGPRGKILQDEDREQGFEFREGKWQTVEEGAQARPGSPPEIENPSEITVKPESPVTENPKTEGQNRPGAPTDIPPVEGFTAEKLRYKAKIKRADLGQIPGRTFKSPDSKKPTTRSGFTRHDSANNQIIADFLEAERNSKVEANPDEGTSGQGDALVNGENHEFKTLQPDTAHQSTQLKDIIERSLKKHKHAGQGSNFVINAAETSLTFEQAQEGINRAAGKFPGRIKSVAIIGPDWFWCWGDKPTWW